MLPQKETNKAKWNKSHNMHNNIKTLKTKMEAAQQRVYEAKPRKF